MSGKGKRIGGKGKTDYTSGVRQSSSTKAGLAFPVARIRRMLKDGKYAKNVSPVAGVYLAAVLEYLMAELLELAGNCARDNNRVRIIPRHLLLAIRNDDELDTLLKKVMITQGGVVPFIHKNLIPLRKEKKMADAV
ncbi:histone-fold-containing protein [Mycena maculata]|uniref:Histone H2A n=1 Tax=Mycena maculata TaxID=230809 RepID=A0AAD7JLG8_9AGAR|nr:histone-fold-containing protein [Mycena maculata]